MTAELSPYIGGGPVMRDARRASRSISRYQAGGQVRVATTDVETDVTIAKIDSGTAVIGHGMGAIVRVAQAHRHLELLAPEASGRLAMLADDHALGVVEAAADHRRILRRL